MPSWNDLVTDINKITDVAQRGVWLDKQQKTWISALSSKREGRNVIFYASAFLQKPQVSPIFLQIAMEDINGFMSVMNGMDWNKGLTLILHTPGGVTNATETIVEYLYQKFSDIEVVIPTFAMSAGTMISLASNRLIMGRQSQLGPIDPQLAANGRSVSARAIVDQFNTAKKEIMAAPASAAAWAPALQSLGPALLQEAQFALDYGEVMVSRWLEKRHFAKYPDAKAKAAAVAKYFNRSDVNLKDVHKSHGRRIDRDEARSQGLDVIDLESDQQLQDIVLTNYHLATLVFEKTTCTKFIMGNHGKVWMKNIKL